MTLAVRFHPLGSTERDLIRQLMTLDVLCAANQRRAIFRTAPEDPQAVIQCGLLSDPASSDDLLATVWAEAQLAADTSLLGLSVGLRIALVPERGRWYADTFVIRTGGRLRAGRGYRHPVSALQAVRRSYVATL